MRNIFPKFPSEGGVARSDGVVHFCNGWRLIEPVESQNRRGGSWLVLEWVYIYESAYETKKTPNFF